MVSLLTDLSTRDLFSDKINNYEINQVYIHYAHSFILHIIICTHTLLQSQLSPER